MKKTSLVSFLLSMTWAFYTICTTVFLYFERAIFSQHFKDEMDYILIGGIAIGCYIAISMGGKLLKTKHLLLVLFSMILVNATLWLLISYNVPSNPWKMGCDSWICEQYGQIALVTLTICISCLLLELSTRVKEARDGSMGGLAGIISSVGIVTVGYLTGFGY